jgi:hypothetical protein
MRIEFAHLRRRSTTGQDIDFAVFDAKPNNNTPAGRDELLAQLTIAARSMDLNVEVAALMYEENRQIKTWGDPFVLDYLSKEGVPAPTHYLDM